MIYHITTAIHDSRTSQRMIDYKARQRRFGGVVPYPEVFPLSDIEEVIIAEVVRDLIKELSFEIRAFNVCRDHMHLIVVCEPEEVSKIMHRIKGKTARACNLYRKPISPSGNKGINPLDVYIHPYVSANQREFPTSLLKDKSTPFWTQKFGCKIINSSRQYRNTVRYIENNRTKHKLSPNPQLAYVIREIRFLVFDRLDLKNA